MTSLSAQVVSIWGDDLQVLTPSGSRWTEADFRGWAAKVSHDVEVSGLHPVKCWASTGLTRAQWSALLRRGAKIDERVAAALTDDDPDAMADVTAYDVNCLRMFVEVMRSYSGVELLAGRVVLEKMEEGSLNAVSMWREHAAKEEAVLDGTSASASNSWGAPQAMAAVLGVFLPPAPNAAQPQYAAPPPLPPPPSHHYDIEVDVVDTDADTQR